MGSRGKEKARLAKLVVWNTEIALGANLVVFAHQLHLWNGIIGFNDSSIFPFLEVICRTGVSLKNWISPMKLCRQLDSLIAGCVREKFHGVYKKWRLRQTWVATNSCTIVCKPSNIITSTYNKVDKFFHSPYLKHSMVFFVRDFVGHWTNNKFLHSSRWGDPWKWDLRFSPLT